VWPFKKEPKTLPMAASVRQGLAELERIGICMRPIALLDDLLYSSGGTLDDPIDYCDLLCILGGGAERGRGGRFSDDIWHLDAECICEDGDYANLLERFCILTKGAMVVTDVEDHVDIEASQAWIDFRFQGQNVHWDIEVNDDWLDPGFYSHVCELVRTVTPDRGFFICALGQDSLISYGDKEQKRKLSDILGLKFSW
jgi:hypothetical protein